MTEIFQPWLWVEFVEEIFVCCLKREKALKGISSTRVTSVEFYASKAKTVLGHCSTTDSPKYRDWFVLLSSVHDVTLQNSTLVSSVVPLVLHVQMCVAVRVFVCVRVFTNAIYIPGLCRMP